MKNVKTMISALRKAVHNKKGMSYVYVAVIVIVLSLIFSVVLEYASLYSLISSTKDNTQLVLDSFCIKKSTDIYNSINNGNDYVLNNNMTSEFMTELSNEISLKLLDNSSNLWYNTSEEEDIIFEYDKPLIASLDNNTLTLKCSYEIVIPIKIGIFDISDLRVPVALKTCYTVY